MTLSIKREKVCAVCPYLLFKIIIVAQAVGCWPPTVGVPSSRLGRSIWFSWWKKRGLGRIFSGFLPFSPTTNFIPPFLHTHIIHFISPRDSETDVADRHPCYSLTIASHPSTGPCVGHELRLILLFP